MSRRPRLLDLFSGAGGYQMPADFRFGNNRDAWVATHPTAGVWAWYFADPIRMAWLAYYGGEWPSPPGGLESDAG